MSNNYENFIYLFGNNQEIKIKDSDGKIVTFFTGIVQELLGSPNYGSKDTPFQTFGELAGGVDNSKDFPAQDTAIERKTEDQFLGGVKPTQKTPNFDLVTFTSDVGDDPRRSHIFYKEGGTTSYAFNVVDEALKYYTFYLSSEILNNSSVGNNLSDLHKEMTLREPSAQQNSNFNYDPNPKLKVLDPARPFTFYQGIMYQYVPYEKKGDPNQVIQPHVQENRIKGFFNAYDKLVGSGVVDGQYFGYSTTDVSTKIGVPYDFQTVLLEDLNAKNKGVQTKQPTYNKIYNYYDSQYEPVVEDVINGGITDERALPSIYDFLFLDKQPSVKAFIKLPNMTTDETNLAGINQYLDNFAKLYSKYLQGTPKADIKYFWDSHGALNWGHTKQFLNPNIILTLEDVGGTPNSVIDVEEVLKQKFLLTEKKAILLSLAGISEDDIATEKELTNPIWVNNLKTGVYFSENSMNTFNETLDKDFVFPFLVKLNIPVETRGPIASLLSEQGLLDSVNSYAASIAVPVHPGDTPGTLRTYSDFYGAVINGVDNKNSNMLYNVKMPGFKIFLKKPPLPALNFNDVLNLGNSLLPPSTKSGTSTDFGGVINQVDNTLLDQPTAVTEEAIFESWKRRKIDEFSAENDISKAEQNKVFFKMIPLFGSSANPMGYGSQLEVWAYCFGSSGVCIGNYIAGHPFYYHWNADEYEKEKELIEAANNIVHIFKNIQYLNILDFTGTDVTPSSLFSEKVYAADMYLDNFHLDATAPKDVFVYSDQPELLDSGNSSLQALITKLKSLKFKSKLQKLLLEGNLLRTPADIHNGKLAHQETLMYEIAKYSFGANGEEKYLQSIFLPITLQEQLSYYDTQIIPYKNYFYKIFAHKAILGTEYVIKTKSKDNKGNPEVNFKNTTEGAYGPKVWFEMPYQVQPFIQVVRVPYYNTKMVNIKVDKLSYSRVEDSPPLPPQVDFVPFRNIDNRILILLNNSIGQIEQYPRALFEEDKEIFDNVALSQDRKPNSKLIFKSDDSQGTFEVFRMTRKPSGYADIATNDSLQTEDLFFIEPEQNNSLVDAILPNQDYYYLFRFRDIHSNISNPTDVYKLRMIHQAGAMPYLTLEVIDLKEEEKKQHKKRFSSVKDMQKYLFIQPNFLQNTINFPPGIVNEAGEVQGEQDYIKIPCHLGDPSGKSVFGKKFKIRLTSKQTGKKIDINLTVESPQTIINE